MSKIYVIYGTMSSSKTANLCMNAHNYEEVGKIPLVIKPSFDTRSKEGKISSRIGLERDCIELGKDDNLYEIVKLQNKVDVCLIDECQFLEPHHIDEIVDVCDVLNISVMCYGLKNSSNGELFESMKRLMFEADKITEVKSMCGICGTKKATHHLRYYKGELFLNVERMVGDVKEGEVRYINCCRSCYYNPPKNLK